MKSTRRSLSLYVATFFVLACANLVQGQRLHDAARDNEAKKAAQLAEEIISKSNFEKQLKNLEVLSKNDLDVYFAGAKRQMELDIRSLRTWGDVAELSERVGTTLSAENFINLAEAKKNSEDLDRDCPDRKTDLGKNICTAQTELRNLRQAVQASETEQKGLEEELKTRLEKIDAIDGLVTQTASLLDSSQQVMITGLADVFLNLAKSYVNYTSKLATIKKQPQNELRLLLQRIAVEALQLEVDHWKTVGEIQLRRASEQKDLLLIVKDVNFRLGQISRCLSTDIDELKAEKISVTFTRARALPACAITVIGSDVPVQIEKEEIISYLFQTLHSAAALAARGETPMKLAELRLAQEEHRFSIRHSAVVARSYEVTLASGTKRLARFYAGGLKPEKIAALINSAATVAIPTVIAIK